MALITEKNRRLKVLHAVHWPVSGITALLKNVIARMPASEVISHILFFHEDAETVADFSRICQTVHCFPKGCGYLQELLGYHRVIQEVAPDILHSHSFQPMVWGSLIGFGRFAHVTTVHNNYPYFTENGAKYFVKRNVEKILLRLAVRRTVAVGRGIYAVLRELGIPTVQLALIENGVNIAARSVSQETVSRVRNELGLDKNQFILATLGRLDIIQKGYDVLLYAIQRASKTHGNLILLFIGDGPDRTKLVGMAAELGVTENVRFVGHQRDPKTYLEIANAYVSSSIFEGFSLAILEAMLCELPVIATGVGAVPDTITHGVSGLIVPPNDFEAIALAIDDFVCGRYMLREMGQRGRAEVVRKFDIEKTAAAYLELYRSLGRDHAVRV